MNRHVALATRIIYRREVLPPRMLWWLAAAGMRDWFRTLARGLEPHLGAGTRPRIARIAAQMFSRRYAHRRTLSPSLHESSDDPRIVPLTMSALYRLHLDTRAAWIFDAIGGAPRGPREWLRAQRLVAAMPVRERWEETTVHLGELLIALTEDLETFPRSRKILGDLCFESGARYGRFMRRALHLDEDPRVSSDPAALAIEVLRMTEYVFRVNPKHWGKSDGATRTGWLEGTACPWFTRPGWEAGHCGIFGQFQSGICSAFDLRYHLAKTIPKHGGDTCRVDLKPIAVRRAKDGGALGIAD